MLCASGAQGSLMSSPCSMLAQVSEFTSLDIIRHTLPPFVVRVCDLRDTQSDGERAPNLLIHTLRTSILPGPGALRSTAERPRFPPLLICTDYLFRGRGIMF